VGRSSSQKADQTMRIAVISDVSGYPWAGSEELWLCTALRALESGHAVTACLHPDLHVGTPLAGFASLGGHLVQWSRGRIARLECLRQRIWANFSSEKLGNPEVILLSAGSLPSLTYVPGLMEFLSGVGVPVVVLCQFNSDSLAISPDERQWLAGLLSYASRVWFVSEHNRLVSRRQFALALESAGVVSNPLRIVLEQPLPWRSDRHTMVFGCVARMETIWKGQDLLLEILAGEQWRSRDWRLRLFGDGPDRERLEKWTHVLGIPDKVCFEGYVRDLVEIWRDTDLMILPSRGEGTPLAVLEAMMCGRPVVTTDVGGNTEVIADEINGFIADAATPKSFGNALERAWNARTRWGEMGWAGHRRAHQLALTDPAAILLDSLVSAAHDS
jgi:glycosyltransferase involved in cell wall biosynthesis